MFNETGYTYYDIASTSNQTRTDNSFVYVNNTYIHCSGYRGRGTKFYVVSKDYIILESDNVSENIYYYFDLVTESYAKSNNITFRNNN